jgi:hypothetical protein
MKRRIALVVVALGALVAGVLYTRSLRSPTRHRSRRWLLLRLRGGPCRRPAGATLLEGLGKHHFAITSRVPEVARWFDQG